MANIKISELSSLNQVNAQELDQVVGGWKKPVYKKYYSYKQYLTINANIKSFNNQNAQNFNTVIGGGKGSLTVAPNTQVAYNIIQ